MGVLVSGFLIMNYIFEYGDNVKKFEKYIKKSDARYLLKYDKVKLIKGGIFSKTYK